MSWPEGLPAINRFVVDPAHLDVLLSLALHGPSDLPAELTWYIPSAGELTGDFGPLSRRDAADVGAALLAMCIASVRHFYADADLPQLPGPDPLPDPGQYEWSDLGKFLSIHEGFVAISTYEFNSNSNPRWYLSPQYLFCNRLRAYLAASLPGCAEARMHWSTEAVLERAQKGSSLERVLGITDEHSVDAEGPKSPPS